MNYTELFYWLVVADNARLLFGSTAGIFTAITVMASIIYFVILTGDKSWESKQEDLPQPKKWIWWSAPFMIISWMAIVFTPSKKDSLLIVAGGGTLQYLTTDSTATHIPKELSNFVLSQLRNMAKESEIELGVKDNKIKIVEDAANMSGKELLDKMKSDSTFTKILLNE